MSEGKEKTRSVFSLIIFIILFFVTVPYVLSYLQITLRKFTIPVEGGPYLSSADSWKTETQLLLQDTTEFWKDKFLNEGLTYTPPELISNFEGARKVCKSPNKTKSIVYCYTQGRIELNRIIFNGISRRAAPGLNHLGISYIFAHLVGHHVQSQLGISLTPKATDPRKHLIQIELQAECFAGMWLRHATKRYGSISKYHLGRVVPYVFVIPEPDMPEIVGAFIEDTRLASEKMRIKWVRVGFNAKNISECNTDNE